MSSYNILYADDIILYIYEWCVFSRGKTETTPSFQLFSSMSRAVVTSNRMSAGQRCSLDEAFRRNRGKRAIKRAQSPTALCLSPPWQVQPIIITSVPPWSQSAIARQPGVTTTESFSSSEKGGWIDESRHKLLSCSSGCCRGVRDSAARPQTCLNVRLLHSSTTGWVKYMYLGCKV